MQFHDFGDLEVICSTRDIKFLGSKLLDVDYLIEAKTSLGALSKNFVGIELDWPVTLGSVTLVRVKSGRVTAT